MSLLHCLMNFVGMKRKEVKIIVVGLNNSGKTSIINHFKEENNHSIDVHPTVGLNVEKFSFKDIGFTVFDMSGHDQYRSLWEHYYKDCQGIIFIIDSSDKLRLIVSKEELDMLLQHPNIIGRRLPILFLANKMDLPDSLTTLKIVASLGLEKIVDKPWHIQATNAISGEGLQPAIEWLTDQLHNMFINTTV